MTVNSYGDHGQPVIQDPPTTIADMTALAAYTKLFGTRIIGTASQRTTFAATFGFTPFRGLEYFESDTFNSYTNDGTAWIGTKTQSGNVAFTTGELTASGGGFSGAKNVNFVTGRFTVAPAVTLGVYTQAANDQHAGIANVTTTGFTLYYWRANLSATTVAWSAVPTEAG